MAKILIEKKEDLILNLISRIQDIANMSNSNTFDIPLYVDFDGYAEQVDFVGFITEYIDYLFVQINKCGKTIHLTFTYHPYFEDVGIVINFYPERFKTSLIDISINYLETEIEVNIFWKSNLTK